MKEQAGIGRDDKPNRTRAGPPSTGDAESVPRGTNALADRLLPRFVECSGCEEVERECDQGRREVNEADAERHLPKPMGAFIGDMR